MPRVKVSTRIVPSAPVAVPVPATPAKSRRKAVARARAQERIAGKAIVFMLLAIASFGASSMSGQVMAEKARQDGYQASKRAQAAEDQEKVLQNEIATLLRPATIDEWAANNGFVSADAASKVAAPSQPVVASLDARSGNGHHSSLVALRNQ